MSLVKRVMCILNVTARFSALYSNDTFVNENDNKNENHYVVIIIVRLDSYRHGVVELHADFLTFFHCH